MVRKVLIYPDPRLKQKSEVIVAPHFDIDLRALSQDMIETMLSAGGIGLAAIQVGVARRLIVMKRADGTSLVMANPSIELLSGDKVPKREGCLSFPGIFETVSRYPALKVRWNDLLGGSHLEAFTGLDAHIIQHEVEHLEGVLLSDRMPRSRRGQVMGELKKLRR
jgi:peptide deformylase